MPRDFSAILGLPSHYFENFHLVTLKVKYLLKSWSLWSKARIFRNSQKLNLNHDMAKSEIWNWNTKVEMLSNSPFYTVNRLGRKCCFLIFSFLAHRYDPNNPHTAYIPPPNELPPSYDDSTKKDNWRSSTEIWSWKEWTRSGSHYDVMKKKKKIKLWGKKEQELSIY